ncbi:protein-disulfide reductase DsbD domain-containing protein [Sphingobacterium rhinopitheci]|uniref:protein-disulfide reductase DsbD domain-containing protein n=1 Tax=Sphingobacterium rhinopitheci TaxID=2781960 RepID=UPI001F5291B1|nr:protein-disulfide reductase DsbD domain-containing protein [Sphingobacterium rhinopitheci]MCI0921475.1 sugar transporter [Sphingobacterium rhinopitheci]
MKNFSLLIVAVLITVTTAVAQIKTPVKWTVASKKLNNKEAVVFIKATIENGWHIYGQNVPNGGPISTSFTFKTSKDYSLNGGTLSNIKAKTKYEDVFKMNVPYFTQEVVFQQKVKLNSNKATTVNGVVEFMACDKTECLPPDEYNFSVTIK